MGILQVVFNSNLDLLFVCSVLAWATSDVGADAAGVVALLQASLGMPLLGSDPAAKQPLQQNNGEAAAVCLQLHGLSGSYAAKSSALHSISRGHAVLLIHWPWQRLFFPVSLGSALCRTLLNSSTAGD